MKERIDIIVPEAELTRNNEKITRLDKTKAFEPTDRVPVVINTNQWAALAARGKTFAEYVHGPKDNLYEQILNMKWRIEHVRDDQPIPTNRPTFQPDFGSLHGVEFEMEITWSENQPPKCTHPLTEIEQIDTLEVQDPAGRLNAKKLSGITPCAMLWKILIYG